MEKLKALYEWYKRQNLFVKFLIPIFIVFGIGTALGSPAEIGYLLTAMIIGAIAYYLYKLYKSKSDS